MSDLVPVDKKVDLPWLKMSDKAQKAVQLSRAVHRTKHGLFAGIPIVCQGQGCPYSETCMALGHSVAPEGEQCPVEIAGILEYYDKYTEELNIDVDNMVQLSLLKSLIDAELTIDRCNAILAKDANILQEIITTVTPRGQLIKNPAPHMAFSIKEKAIKQKNEALQLLNSTPKDKAKTSGANIIDPSTHASMVVAEARRLRELERQEKTVEAEFKIRDENKETAD